VVMVHLSSPEHESASLGSQGEVTSCVPEDGLVIVDAVYKKFKSNVGTGLFVWQSSERTITISRPTKASGITGAVHLRTRCSVEAEGFPNRAHGPSVAHGPHN
jgi:hypothetical protein